MKSSKDEWGRRGGEGEGKVGAQVGSLQRIHFPFHFFARVLITSDGVKQSFEQTFFRRGQVKKKRGGGGRREEGCNASGTPYCINFQVQTIETPRAPDSIAGGFVVCDCRA